MEIKVLRPLKAIRANCIDCSGDSLKAIRECQIIKCPLWPYRMGRRPSIHSLTILRDFDEENSPLPDDFFDRNGNDE